MGNARETTPRGFNEYRGIYLKRIPTYSFPLLLEVMEELGVDHPRVLKNTGLLLEEAAQEGTLVSFMQALKLMRNILATSPRPDIGLLIGSRYHINTYGVLGYAMMSCPTWGDALKVANHYYRAASSLTNIRMELNDKEQTLSYVATPFYADMVDIEPFTVEKLFASLIAVSKPLMAQPGTPTKVSFAYPEPTYADAYHKTFPCPIQFDAPENRFELSLEVLQQPMLLANSMSAEIGRKMCEEFMSRQERESQEITRQVTELLLSTPGQMLGMEAVADKLNLHSRTLRRNLQAEDTSFQDIVDQLRQDLSKHYLKRSRLNLDSIAQLVGFSETTNFRRAFKRWEGVPPAEYRRQVLAAPSSP